MIEVQKAHDRFFREVFSRIEQGIRDSILELLRVDFPAEMTLQGEAIAAKLELIHDPDVLRNLLRGAAKSETLADFRQSLSVTI